MQQNHASFEELRPRAVDRVRVDFDAFLTFENMPELPVFIRDLSSCGFSCCCAERLAIGSPLTLRIPDLGEFTGAVAWQLGAQAGIRFDSPLSLTTMMSIVLTVVQEELATSRHDPSTGAAP